MNELVNKSPEFLKQKTFVYEEFPILKNQTEKNINKLKGKLNKLESKVGLTSIDSKKSKLGSMLGSKLFQPNETSLEDQILETERELHLEEKKLSSQSNIRLRDLVDLEAVGKEARENLKEFYYSIEKAESKMAKAQEEYQKAISEYKNLKGTSEEYIRVITNFEDMVMKEGFTPLYSGHRWTADLTSLLGNLQEYRAKFDVKTKHDWIKF